MNKFVKVLFNILVCFVFVLLLIDFAEVVSKYNDNMRAINNDAGIEVKQNTIVGSNWQFTLPENWTIKPLDLSKEDVTLSSFSNDSNIFLFVKSRYYGSQDQLSIDTIRYIRTNGLQIQSTTSAKLSDLGIIRIESSRDKINEITIAALKDEHKYFLTCTYTISKIECEQIINSFMLN